MKIIKLIFATLIFIGCSDQQRIDELTSKLKKAEKANDYKSEQIEKYLAELQQIRDSIRPEYAYAFEPTSESNIVKQTNKPSQAIDQITLSDSVDTEYVFDHTTTISQLREPRLNSLFTTFKETKEIVHPGGGNIFPYVVRTFILCEEDDLPIETENCTDNIYILVQPTELGYENNLFKISRLFNSEISELKNTNDGVVLTLEHSRFPRTQLNVLIKPELVKFLE